MNLVSLLENKKTEKRVAVTPEIAKKYSDLGFNLFLPNNYASHLGFNDDDYKSLGVNFFENENDLISQADIIIQLGLPDDDKLKAFKENQTLIGTLNTFFAYKLVAETGNLFRILVSPKILTPFFSIILSTSVNTVLPPWTAARS